MLYISMPISWYACWVPLLQWLSHFYRPIAIFLAPGALYLASSLFIILLYIINLLAYGRLLPHRHRDVS